MIVTVQSQTNIFQLNRLWRPICECFDVLFVFSLLFLARAGLALTLPLGKCQGRPGAKPGDQPGDQLLRDGECLVELPHSPAVLHLPVSLTLHHHLLPRQVQDRGVVTGALGSPYSRLVRLGRSEMFVCILIVKSA